MNVTRGENSAAVSEISAKRSPIGKAMTFFTQTTFEERSPARQATLRRLRSPGEGGGGGAAAGVSSGSSSGSAWRRPSETASIGGGGGGAVRRRWGGGGEGATAWGMGG